MNFIAFSIFFLILTLSNSVATVNFIPDQLPKSIIKKNSFIKFEKKDFIHLLKRNADQYYIDWYSENNSRLTLLPLFFQLDEKNLSLWKKHEDYVSLFDVGICFTDQCALTNLYSMPEGARIAYLHKNYNINSSYYRFQDYVIASDKRHLDHIVKKFTPSELESLIVAVKSYPGFLRNFETKEVHAMRITKTFDDPISIANARMMYFDLWSKSEGWFQVYAAIHEFAHRIGSYYEVDESEQWSNTANLDYNNYKAGKKSCVTKYIHSYLNNPEVKIEKILSEDFAEMVVMYLTKPTFMKAQCLSKYNFLKTTIFRGGEVPLGEMGISSDFELGISFHHLEKNLSKSIEDWFGQASKQSFANNHSKCKGIYLYDLNFNQYVQDYISCWGEKTYFELLNLAIAKQNFKNPLIVKKIYEKDYKNRLNTKNLISTELRQEKVKQIKNEMLGTLKQVIVDLLKQKASYMTLYRNEGEKRFCHHFWLGEADGGRITSLWSRSLFNNYDWSLGNLKNKHRFVGLERNICSHLYTLYQENHTVSDKLLKRSILKIIPKPIRDSLLN